VARQRTICRAQVFAAGTSRLLGILNPRDNDPVGVDMRCVVPLRFLLTALPVLACFCSFAQPAPSVAAERDAAHALEQQGDFAGAEATWQTILRSHPASAEAFAHIGFLESQQQHYGDAVVYYRKAAAIDPSIPGLKMNLGLALFKGGDMREAAHVFLTLYPHVPTGSPDAQRLQLLLGMAYYGGREYAAAVPWLRKAMASDPQNLPYRLVLAHACLWSRQYKCVLEIYHQILSLNAESAEADMLAGEAYDEMRDHQDAIEQFRNAAKADPNYPGVHFGLGYLLWCQSQFQDAAQQFQLESRNSPGDAEALAYWADSVVRLNQPNAARPLVERALRLSSGQEMPWLDLGILDAAAGDNETAFHDFQQAARIAPSDVQVHWRLARLYQSMGRRAEAHTEFEKTKTLTRAADKTVMEKLQANLLHQSQGETDRPATGPDKSTE
jgi:tetratricopeptide (TPR) repeat protein